MFVKHWRVLACRERFCGVTLPSAGPSQNYRNQGQNLKVTISTDLGFPTLQAAAQRHPPSLLARACSEVVNMC